MSHRHRDGFMLRPTSTFSTRAMCSGKRTPRCDRAARSNAFASDTAPFASDAAGVGHGNKVESLSDVPRTDARSAQIDRCKGVTRTFHVRVNKVEPIEAVLARNLFAKHDARAALRDEVVEERPKVPLVVEPTAHAANAEWLARARSCPYLS